MATVKFLNNIFSNDVKTFSVNEGTSIDDILKQNTNDTVYDDVLVECYDLETGKTYYAAICEDRETLNAVVQVNGKDVSLDYEVKVNDIVEIVITPSGGKIGAQIAGAIAGIFIGAIAIASIAVTWGASTGLVGFLAFVGGVGGGIAGAKIAGDAWDMKHQGNGSSTKGKDSERLPDVRGATNQVLTDQAFPAVFGKHLAAPFIIGSPYNVITGNRGQENYIHVLYEIGYAPLRITDIKLGDQYLAHNKRWSGNQCMKNIWSGKLEGIDEGTNHYDMEYFQQNTSIPLSSRPQITASQMIAAGWDVPDDDSIYTVYSSSYSNQNGTKTVLVTPILNNGTVLSPAQLETDANNILSDQSATHDVLLNTFTGTDSIGQADEYAEELHAAQGSYYGLSGDIVNTWKNNDVSVEILQQIPGENVNYGDVYPHARIQNDINADVLFIADGSLEDIDSGKNISYKGVGLKDGLRNNPIYFTEQYPKSATVELDFAQGLYKSRSETSDEKSEVKNYKIPMWIGLQWRIYSDDNPICDGNTAGDDVPFPTWNQETKSYNPVTYKGKTGVIRGWNSFDSINNTVNATAYTAEDRYLDIAAHTGNNLKNEKTRSGQTETTVTITGSISYLPAPYDTNPYKLTNLTLAVSSSYSDVIKLQAYDNSSWITVLELPIGGSSTSVPSTSVPNNKWRIKIGEWTSGEFSLTGSTKTIPISGYVYSADINNNWLNSKAFNLQSLGGDNEDTDGINEIRCITSIDFVEWSRANLLSEDERESEYVEDILANKMRSYFYDGTNSTKSIEVRVVRISPCYLDEVKSTKEKSAFKFNDIFTWKTLSSTMLDGDALINKSAIIQKRPLSEELMRGHCILSLKAKTDTVDQLSNTIRKLSCIAESFAPYYDKEQKKWFPENVVKQKRYIRYDAGNNVWNDITEQEYYQDRQNRQTGVRSKCIANGNNFVSQIIDVINTNAHKDEKGRIFIPNDDMDNGQYKTGCDGTLKYCNNNVASIFMLAGIGPHLGKDALGYTQSHFDVNGIGDFNMLSMSKWHSWAERVTDGSTYASDGYHYNHKGVRIHHNKGDLVEVYFAANAYVYNQETLESIFANISIAGRSVYTKDNKGRITVVIDKPEKYPVALINQQNTLKSSYTISYAESPSGIQVSFPDEDDGYETNQLYCMADGEDEKNPFGAIEPYGFKFVTNNIQLWSLGRYILANRILNKEVVTKQLGIEGASITLGDLVLVQDDTMLIGTDNGGRITQLIENEQGIYGFVIDNMYHFTGETEIVDGVEKSSQGVVVMQPSQYKESRIITLRLMKDGGTAYVNGVLYTMTKGMTNTVLFDIPISKNADNQDGSDYYIYKPEAGNMVGFGKIGKVTSTYRVIKIKASEKRTYDFTLMKYQEDLYNYGAQLPSFQNHMTIPDRSGENSFSLSNNVNQNDLTKSLNELSDQVQQQIGTITSYECSLSMSSIGSAVLGNVFKDGSIVEGTLYYKDFYGTSGQQPTTEGGTGTVIDGIINIPAVQNADKHIVNIYSDAQYENIVCSSFVSYGATGSGSSSYWLICDASSVNKDVNGNFNPSSINLVGMTQSGTSAPTTYSGRIGIAVDTGSGYGNETTYDDYSKTFTIPANTKKIRCRLYLAGGTSVKLDEEIVTVTSDGGYQDYKFAVGAFDLDDTALRNLDWQETPPPTTEQAPCLYMATKWIN